MFTIHFFFVQFACEGEKDLLLLVLPLRCFHPTNYSHQLDSNNTDNSELLGLVIQSTMTEEGIFNLH